MGHIIKLLGKKKVRDKPSAWGNRLTVEDAEDIHLHYRSKRLEFSDNEFLDFADCITKAASNLRKKRKKEVNNIGKELAYTKINPVSDKFPNKFTVEINKEAYHIHLRELRLDFYSTEEFEEFSSKLTEAYTEFLDYQLTKTKRIVTNIPMKIINPFDGGHRLVKKKDKKKRTKKEIRHGFIAPPQKLHNQQVDTIVKAIKEGKKIRPIAVRFGKVRLQRVDGFCRYWAHKICGFKTIECILERDLKPGAQDKQHFLVNPQEYQQILKGKIL